MESEKDKLIQSVKAEESVCEQNDEMEYLKNDTINLEKILCPIENEEKISGNNKDIIETDNVATKDVSISETPNLSNVNGEQLAKVVSKLAFIHTLDINNILNTKEIFSESDVVFDVTKSKTFYKLLPETDLNVPPVNWPNPSVDLPNPIKIKIKNKESASFSIANMFPECNNKVNIVADADVIKQIFKIPYNKEYVSLMVRKVGNVLLIDNFDINCFSNIRENINEKNLNKSKEYFEELKKIHSRPCKTNNANKKLHQRNLHSKFLFRSVVDDPEASDHLTSTDSQEAGRMEKFNRIIYWSFEKTKMLIGTNVPKTNLFENEASRNVSLHIARAEKPLKRVNAIDIWLDNLMCDIPEAVVCFHANGMVKHYECIQTQDIPYLLGSPFSVIKIKMAVQNIFSFLLNQEYRTGQVYCLVKCKNDNVLKFVDLNMSERTDDQVKLMKTPFAYECGILSYKFGHNQYYSSINRKELTNTLLMDASTTLHIIMHPEIIASAKYLLVDLKFSYEIFQTPLFTLSKVEFGKCKMETKTLETRCLNALTDINNGLKCLKKFRLSENSQEKKLTKNINSNNSHQDKFQFKTDKQQAKDEFFYINVRSLFPKEEHRLMEALPTWEDFNEDLDYWKNYLKFLFYQKAELIYGILAQQYFYYDKFDLCLRSLDMMVRFNQVKTRIEPSSHTIPINFVLVMAGDCCKLASTVDLSKSSNNSNNNREKIEKTLIIDEGIYSIKPNKSRITNLQLNLMDYSQVELLNLGVKFYVESWIRIASGKGTKKIDENMHFISKKVFASHLTLGRIYYDMLDKSGKESSYMDYFEQSKKYLNIASKIACSPLEKSSAVFRYSELYYLLFNISLHKVTPSCKESNLSEYFKIFLDSAKDALEILYDTNEADYEHQWHNYFNKSFSSIDAILAGFTTNIKNEIVDKLRHSIIESSTTALKEILKICEWQKQRYNNAESYFACGRTNWCIATNLFKEMKLGSRSNNVTIIRDHFLKAVEYFSQKNLWWFHITVLINLSNFTLHQSQDEFDFPLKLKMENIRCCLEVCYQACRSIQEITIENEQIHNTLKKCLPELHVNIERMLSRGIDAIRTDSRIAKTEFDELQIFNNYLYEFQDIYHEDYKLYFAALIDTLNQMGISMKFSK